MRVNPTSGAFTPYDLSGVLSFTGELGFLQWPHDFVYVFCVEGFLFQERLGHLVERLHVVLDELCGLLIGPGHDAAHLVIDLLGRQLTVVPVLSDLPSKEDLLLLFPKLRGPRLSLMPKSQTILRAKLGGPFDVVSRPGGLPVQDNFLGGPPAHEDAMLLRRYSLG